MRPDDLARSMIQFLVGFPSEAVRLDSAARTA